MKIKKTLFIALFWGLLLPAMAMAEDKINKLEDVVVTGTSEGQQMTLTPEKTTIDIDTYEITGVAKNIGDIIRDQPVIDFRGASDLVPGDLVDGDDTVWMRGFGSNRFVTAVDGANIHKPGGRNTFHVVDYSLLPTFLIDRVDILPGPHSALYPGLGIGGVVNLITRTPAHYDTAKPDLSVTTSFKSYNTLNHSAYVRGSAHHVTYDIGFQKYATDGYLRNAEADIDTFFGRIGYILPSQGYIALTASHTDVTREIPVKNDPALGDYDDGFPVVTRSSYYEWQTPGWNETAESYRLNYNQPSPIGTWDLNAYYGEEEWEKTILRKNASDGYYDIGWQATWYQQGGKLQDTITFSDRHQTIIGADLEQYFDGMDTKLGSPSAFDKEKRVELKSYFAQHKWQMIPCLTLTAGLRYEQADIRVDNMSSRTGNMLITGKPRWIERGWDEWVPKSFLTYKLDDMAVGLRDTSVSLGVSKIWRAPVNFGDFNPRGMPAGAWTEPEHGIGYDIVFSRRLIRDIQLKINYAYYEIEDYLAWNWDYAAYTPGRDNPVTPGMEYKDYIINLEEVTRHGLEVQLNGHLTDDLSFYAGYAYQTFDNKGGEPAGKAALDDVAKNRFNAGLRYHLSENTLVLLDYKFQDEQVVQKSEEVAPDEWVFMKIPMDASHVFDLAVQQTLLKNQGPLKKAAVKVYINNLFDEDYENLSGYPATDRTFGAALSFDF